MYDQMQGIKRRMYYTVLLEYSRYVKRDGQLASFLGGSEPAEAHHVHHIVGAINFHRRNLRKLETCLFFLCLLCGFLLCTSGQLLIANLSETLVKVESFRFRRLLGLCA